MFEPQNELGVIVLFAEQCKEAGYKIVKIQSAYPDAVVSHHGQDYLVEFEYLSGNFRLHKHDPVNCDFVICWIHNDNSLVVPVLELSDPTWKVKTIEFPSPVGKTPEYWKQKFLELGGNRSVRGGVVTPDILINVTTYFDFCPMCNQVIFSSRATYCSDACRQKAYRERNVS